MRLLRQQDNQRSTSVGALYKNIREILTVYIVSSGFASVHPNNTLTINAVEAFELSAFDKSVGTAIYIAIVYSPRTGYQTRYPRRTKVEGVRLRGGEGRGRD